jgi:hypothetical protein
MKPKTVENITNDGTVTANDHTRAALIVSARTLEARSLEENEIDHWHLTS